MVSVVQKSVRSTGIDNLTKSIRLLDESVSVEPPKYHPPKGRLSSYKLFNLLRLTRMNTSIVYSNQHVNLPFSSMNLFVW